MPVIQQSRTRRHPRALDLLACVAVAGAVVAAILEFQALFGSDAFLRWGAFSAFTALFFWAFIRDCATGKRSRFWPFFAGCLLVHTALWAPALLWLKPWSLYYFGAMFLEILAYESLYQRFLNRRQSAR